VAWLTTQLRALRLEREARQVGEAVFSSTGGARLDIFNLTWPFATLTVTPTWISIVTVGPKYRFHRREVRSLSRYDRPFSTGLRIEHERPDYPELVVFWTCDFGRLRAALEALGYVVHSPP
jgi:hypothetical protein